MNVLFAVMEIQYTRNISMTLFKVKPLKIYSPTEILAETKNSNSPFGLDAPSSN